MDAVKFLREKNRMCNFFYNQALCSKCPIQKLECGTGELDDVEQMIVAVEAVERWSTQHPIKTRQSEFLKMFPDSGKDKDGVIIVPPCAVEKSRFGGIGIRCNVSEKDCVQCKHDYWLEEVEE